MFLSIAALAARRSGHSELVMIAENGQMAIHLPLSAARIGAFSTHTAHPDFVYMAGEFFSELLGHPVRITNPYLYRTKAEVIAKLISVHPEAVKLSVSCWRGSRLSQNYNHCGECIPCLIRRVAVEFHGVILPEYERDLLSLNVGTLPPSDEGRRNATELAEFAYTFDAQSDAEIEFDYPDLVSEHIDRVEAIRMYRRFAKEAQLVLSRYTGMMSLLPATATVPRAASSLQVKRQRSGGAQRKTSRRKKSL
jgi:hypothetical protein